MFLVVGDVGLEIQQDYPQADAGYLAKLLTTAVQLASRWDGRAAFAWPGE